MKYKPCKLNIKMCTKFVKKLMYIYFYFNNLLFFWNIYK